MCATESVDVFVSLEIKSRRLRNRRGNCGITSYISIIISFLFFLRRAFHLLLLCWPGTITLCYQRWRTKIWIVVDDKKKSFVPIGRLCNRTSGRRRREIDFQADYVPTGAFPRPTWSLCPFATIDASSSSPLRVPDSAVADHAKKWKVVNDSRKKKSARRAAFRQRKLAPKRSIVKLFGASKQSPIFKHRVGWSMEKHTSRREGLLDTEKHWPSFTLTLSWSFSVYFWMAAVASKAITTEKKKESNLRITTAFVFRWKCALNQP